MRVYNTRPVAGVLDLESGDADGIGEVVANPLFKKVSRTGWVDGWVEAVPAVAVDGSVWLLLW